MRMQEHLGILVLDRHGIEIPQLYPPESAPFPSIRHARRTLTIHQQLVPLQRLLESGTHERIPRTRVDQDPEVDPKDEEVDDEGPDDEPGSAGEEVFGDVSLRERVGQRDVTSTPPRRKGYEGGGKETYHAIPPLNIHNLPEIPHDGGTDGHKRE